jgi:N-acetyl-anhydromuramyl-L-alanine amidase AmpD
MVRLLDRQISRRWPLLAASAAGAVLLSCGVVLVRDLLHPPVAPDPGSRRVPAPPTQAPWVSPLLSSCPAVDPQLRRRLTALQHQLPGRIRQLRIDPSNYGQRFQQDAYGNRLDPRPALVVLHETVYGIGSAINTFTTHHPQDHDQVSYHVLIGEQGQVVQAVPPELRAFGAGNSAFQGRWVVTSPRMPGSVNNFALHISLETPLDGENSAPSHSGYSRQQYDALAVLLAEWMRKYNIAADHITTHRHVDLGNERADPRSFDWEALAARLQALGMIC